MKEETTKETKPTDMMVFCEDFPLVESSSFIKTQEEAMVAKW